MNIKHTITTFLLILIILVGVLPWSVSSQAQLYLKVAQLQDTRFEKTLVIEVYLANVKDLYGADIQLGYDSSQLQVQDANPNVAGIQISPGPLLVSADPFIISNQANPEEEVIDFALTLLSPTPPISGEGVLATATFTILDDKPTLIKVHRAELALADQTALPMAVQDLDIAAFQISTNTSALGYQMPSQSDLWRMIMFIGSILVFSSIFFFLFWLNRKTAMPEDISKQLETKAPGIRLNVAQSSIVLARQGHQALGRGAEHIAYNLFNRAIELDPANTEAWVGKGLVAQHPTEKRICFERVLALEPRNEVAKEELLALKNVPS